MMNNFWSSVAAAIIGGLVAASIAWQLFKAERRARQEERSVDQVKQLRREWGESSARLISALRTRIDSEQPIGAGSDSDIDEALMYMLLDGTDESLVMSNWVRMKLDESTFSGLKATFTSNSMQFQVIRAMLIGWVRGDPGVIVAVKRQLDAEAK